MCTQKPPYDYSEQLYQRYREAFNTYIDGKVGGRYVHAPLQPTPAEACSNETQLSVTAPGRPAGRSMRHVLLVVAVGRCKAELAT